MFKSGCVLFIYFSSFFIQIDWHQHKVVREAPWSTDPDEMVKHLQDWAEGWSPVDSKPSDVWRCLLFRGRDRRIQVAYGTATSKVKDGESMSRHVKARRLAWSGARQTEIATSRDIPPSDENRSARSSFSARKFSQGRSTVAFGRCLASSCCCSVHSLPLFQCSVD